MQKPRETSQEENLPKSTHANSVTFKNVPTNTLHVFNNYIHIKNKRAGHFPRFKFIGYYVAAPREARKSPREAQELPKGGQERPRELKKPNLAEKEVRDERSGG